MSITEIDVLSPRLVEIGFEFLLRSCVLLAVGALALTFLRSRSTEIRHFVACGMLYGILCLPVLQFSFPPAIPARSNGLVQWTFAATAVYALLSFVLLLRLALGVLRVPGIVRRSEPILDRDLQELAHDIWLESLSSFKPRIRASADVNVPMVAGIHEFSILLPSSWRSWRDETLRTALVHEMAHVRRGDPQTAFLAALTTSVFWIHPLVYWLHRQLAILSEQACDEAALRYVKPEQYARILIEFAANVTATGNRLAAISAFVSHRSSLKRRIERIFSSDRYTETHPRLIRLLFIALSFPVLFLIAVAPFNPLQAQNHIGQNVISVADQAQARRLEAELQHDPSNLRVRDALIVFYANERNEPQFAKHIAWLVEHHPEDPIVAVTSNFFLRPENYERLNAAWQEALQMHSDSAEVLYHAGLFFEPKDPQRALDLFTRAKDMTRTDSHAQARYLDAIAFLYAAAVTSDVKNGDPNWRFNNIAISANTAVALRADVDTSTDPQFLSEVGTWLVKLGDDQLAQLGLANIENAIELDPRNAKWTETLESAKAEPIRRRNVRLLTGH